MSARSASVAAAPARAWVAVATAARRAARVLGALRWYLRGILGADAYEHYLAHHRASGCSSAPMTEREFWRDKLDWQDRNPEGRCC